MVFRVDIISTKMHCCQGRRNDVTCYRKIVSTREVITLFMT